MNYDKNKLCANLKKIRINRKNLYNKGKDPDFEKYYCCQTQELFADALDVNRRTVMKWENGEALPSLDNLLQICNLLDCNMDYFLGADELSYINSVSKASHFTGISPEIISLAKENSDYLDCLNFFMLPTHCSELFNEVKLSAWKNFWINENMLKIKNPLLDIIKKSFDAFYLSTPMEDIELDSFKKYTMHYLPESKLNFTDSGNDNSMIYIKDCFSFPLYKEFSSKCPSSSQYGYFIDYICSLLFASLQNSIYLELHKKKIADRFISVLDEYLKDI